MHKEVLELLKERPELLPEPYCGFASIIGVDDVIKIATRYGGSLIYLPKIDNASTIARDICIQQEYNGYNIRELAAKYRLADQTIKRIASKKNTDSSIAGT